MVLWIILTIVGLLMVIGSFIIPKQKREIVNGGTIVNGKITEYLTKKQGRTLAIQYIVAFNYNGEHYERPTLLPAPFFVKKIGKEVDVYFNEKHPDNIIVKGDYWAEFYAVVSFIIGIAIVVLGVIVILT